MLFHKVSLIAFLTQKDFQGLQYFIQPLQLILQGLIFLLFERFTDTHEPSNTLKPLRIGFQRGRF